MMIIMMNIKKRLNEDTNETFHSGFFVSFSFGKLINEDKLVEIKLTIVLHVLKF